MKQAGTDSQLLDKSMVRRDFNDAAGCYDKTAVLQRSVSDRLVERLDLITIRPERILDLGSGTGVTAKILSGRYRGARIYQADIAVNMLKASRKKTPRFFSRQSYVCTDAERLPLADGSMDLVFSSLMLQWCQALGQVFSEVSRVLSPGGLFIFSSLGPDTLHELRDSWKAADDLIHVNAFIDMHDLGDGLIHADFEHPVMEMEYFNLEYPDVMVLMRDLKQLGAHNNNRGRRRTLTGKNRLSRMLTEYEKSRRAGKLPATYEVVYGHAWKREVTARPVTRRTQTAVPLSSIRRPRTGGGE